MMLGSSVIIIAAVQLNYIYSYPSKPRVVVTVFIKAALAIIYGFTKWLLEAYTTYVLAYSNSPAGIYVIIHV